MALIPQDAEANTLAYKANDLMVTSIMHIMQMTSYLKPVSVSVDSSCWISQPITRFSLWKFPLRLTSNQSHPDELSKVLRERSIDIASGTERPYVFELGMAFGSYFQVENVLRGKLKTSVPPELRERGVRECDDVIAVWVASHPTTAFELLELPKIGSSHKRPPSKIPNASNIMTREDMRGLGADCTGVNFRIHTSQL
ncbi:hypothetical protein EV127DRAFT_495772 [Xylaria flabelliformis]|nr:hypothetical protein EV127DRAFT_495772 [Xylaria flabelliformis]